MAAPALQGRESGSLRSAATITQVTIVKTTLILLGCIAGLLAALEILNALYEAFRHGMIEDWNRRAEKVRKEGASILRLLLLPVVLVRFAIIGVGLFGRFVSLILHEASHALAQLAFLGRPQIVLCKNGGYSQAQPWARAIPLMLLHKVGYVLGGGVMALAPIVAMSALLYLLVALLTPLDLRAIIGQAAYLLQARDFAALREIGESFVRAFELASALGIAGLVIGVLLVAPGMTPSSTDYYESRYHLVAYAAAAVASTQALAMSPRAMTIAFFASLVLGVALSILRTPFGRAAIGLGCFFLTSAVIVGLGRYGVLGRDPLHLLQGGLAALAVVLLLAALVYVAFVALFLVATLLTFRPSAIIGVLRLAPRELASVFTTFDTCTRCNVHFRKVCDGCGRTAEEIAAEETSAP
jgi:hypothetical protein